jgi:hypothetical protein
MFKKQRLKCLEAEKWLRNKMLRGVKVNVYGMKSEGIWEHAALIGERLWDER